MRQLSNKNINTPNAVVPTNFTTGNSENSKRVRSMNRQKFIDNTHSADSSLFLDGVKPATHHETSFNERIDEGERMQL